MSLALCRSSGHAGWRVCFVLPRCLCSQCSAVPRLTVDRRVWREVVFCTRVALRGNICYIYLSILPPVSPRVYEVSNSKTKYDTTITMYEDFVVAPCSFVFVFARYYRYPIRYIVYSLYFLLCYFDAREKGKNEACLL